MAGSEGGASLSHYTNLTFEDLFDLLYCPDLERYPELLGDNIPDGDGSIQPNGSSNAFCITITAHESWTQFYQEFMETLDIPEHISNREGSTTITIRICRREILQLLQDVITNNNLFHLKRKWSKLMIKEPSASES